LERVFVETPGVRLTTAAAAQRAGLDRQVCRLLLLRLTEKGFLEQRLRGEFSVRPSEAP
jgi:predicted transcriptional regulator of viral defense system